MSIHVHNRDMNSLQTAEPALDEACCAPSGQRVLSAEDARRKALVFKALADPNRLRLLSIVKGAGADGRRPGNPVSPGSVLDVTVRSMRKSDSPEVQRSHSEGIATGQAAFEAGAPDWRRF